MVVPAGIVAPGAVNALKDWTGKRGVLLAQAGDASALIERMAAAHAHRYVEDTSTVWANSSMVFVHVNEAGPRTIHFRQPCRGREVFSGRMFDATSGRCTWEFPAKSSALFLFG